VSLNDIKVLYNISKRGNCFFKEDIILIPLSKIFKLPYNTYNINNA